MKTEEELQHIVIKWCNHIRTIEHRNMTIGGPKKYNQQAFLVIKKLLRTYVDYINTRLPTKRGSYSHLLYDNMATAFDTWDTLKDMLDDYESDEFLWLPHDWVIQLSRRMGLPPGEEDSYIFVGGGPSLEEMVEKHHCQRRFYSRQSRYTHMRHYASHERLKYLDPKVAVARLDQVEEKKEESK